MKRQIVNPSKFFVILAAFMLLAVQGVYGQMVSIDPATVESPAAGEQLTVNINLTGGMNVAGYQVTVTFDPTALSNASIANGDYLPAGAFVAPVPATDTSPSPIRVRHSIRCNHSAHWCIRQDGDGTLADSHLYSR